MRPFDEQRPLLLIGLMAAAAPTLLAFNVSPSPTFLNQALAFFGWGVFAAAVALSPGLRAPDARALRPAAPVLLALALVAAAAAGSALWGSLPGPLALSGAATLAAAMVMVAVGVTLTRGRTPDAAASAFAAFCIAWVVTGLLNVAVGAVQVFAPGWADGSWIARSGLVGRAVGNLRQPNHLSSLLLWAAIGTVGLLELRRLGLRAGAALLALIVLGVVLTASRTGVVGIALLALWALVDRRLQRSTRALLLATPVVYAAGWALMALWSRLAQATFGGEQRLAEADLSASRFGIWADTLTLIRQHPWGGVGFGEFNFAWTLTTMPQRPTAFFDHSHNLPLQLLVELGLPLGGAVLALLLWGLFRALRRAAQGPAAATDGAAPDPAGVATRCAIAMLVLIGLHSLLEYPLWYAYFLLPASLAFGIALGHGPAAAGQPAARDEPASPHGTRLMHAAGGLAIAVAALFAVADYGRVAAIFHAGETAKPLAERIERGRSSWLFAHHAEYAAATVADPPGQALAAFDVASHYLIDTRLLLAWARALAETGDLERARHLAERLREFRNPQAAEFLGACAAATADATPPPWQCSPPTQRLDWRDFRPR